MFIGHIPAGYIVSKLSYSRFSKSIGNYRAFVFWGIFGSVAPDLDMLYFYFINHRQTHHHKYITHYPILWGTLIVLSLFLLKSPLREKIGSYSLIFSVSGFIHMILDSIVGDIWWLAPFGNKPFSLITVHPLYKPWWLNFILNWSFLLEIILVISGFWLSMRTVTLGPATISDKENTPYRLCRKEMYD